MGRSNPPSGSRPPVPNKPAPPGARRPAAPARPGARAPTALQSGAVLAAARQRPGRAAQDKYAGQQIIKLGILLVVGICVVLVIVFGVTALRGEEAPARGNDEQVRKVMRNGHFQEANKWLSEGNQRTFMGHNPGQSETLVKRLYDLGAKQVLADGARQSMRIIIELPEDPDARRKLFAWHDEWREKYGAEYGRERDVGQQYLLAPMPFNR